MKQTVLRVLAIWIAGVVLGAGFLLWCRQSLPDIAEGHAVLLLAQLLAAVAMTALYVEAMWQGENRVFLPLIGFLISLVTMTGVAALCLPESLNLSPVAIMKLHATQMLPLFALALGRRLFTSVSTGGLEVLCGGSVLLLLPFLLDTLLMQNRDHDTMRAVMDWSLSLSSWPQACEAHLKLDVFKANEVYRAFSFGERLYQFPTESDIYWRIGVFSLACLGVGAVGWASRRLMRRLLDTRGVIC